MARRVSKGRRPGACGGSAALENPPKMAPSPVTLINTPSPSAPRANTPSASGGNTSSAPRATKANTPATNMASRTALTCQT